MVTIYCIEDINDLKYVGSTSQTLGTRLCSHRCDKRNLKKRQCSSSKLNLEYCIIYPLETCNECDRQERESYWIDKIDCVNERTAKADRDKYKEYKNQLNKYQRSWAIDSHYNNLLWIDCVIFL
jgi:hypothetical protein